MSTQNLTETRLLDAIENALCDDKGEEDGTRDADRPWRKSLFNLARHVLGVVQYQKELYEIWTKNRFPKTSTEWTAARHILKSWLEYVNENEPQYSPRDVDQDVLEEEFFKAKMHQPRGRSFFGCSRYPDCTQTISWNYKKITSALKTTEMEREFKAMFPASVNHG